MKKYIVSIMLIGIGVISISLYANKCHGDTCDTKNEEEISKLVNISKKPIYLNMNPTQIADQAKLGGAVLLDVREKFEWYTGHIEGAKHIPLGELNAETVKDLPKDLPIYIYCRSGSRAGRAQDILQNLGFSKAENIGGVIEWVNEGGELVK